jgi:hypothetical protein
MSARRIGRRTDRAAFNATGTQAVFVALLCALVAITGCNDGRKPGTARLEGRVTIDGQPPPAGAIGTISFRATGQGQAASTSAQIVDGKYKCDDVPLGDIVVFVQLVQKTGKMVSDGGRSYEELRNLVSSKHDNGISLKITDDNSSQDFELEGNTSPQ